MKRRASKPVQQFFTAGDFKYEPTYSVPGRMYFYVWGYTKSGREVLRGPITSREVAIQKLAELSDGDIFELPTRNLAAATRTIKEKLSDRGIGVDEVLKPMLHEKGYAREVEKELQSQRAQIGRKWLG